MACVLDAVTAAVGLPEAARGGGAPDRLRRSVWPVDEIRRFPVGEPARTLTQSVASTQARSQFVAGGSR
jgi:hypothetical protein